MIKKGTIPDHESRLNVSSFLHSTTHGIKVLSFLLFSLKYSLWESASLARGLTPLNKRKERKIFHSNVFFFPSCFPYCICNRLGRLLNLWETTGDINYITLLPHTKNGVFIILLGAWLGYKSLETPFIIINRFQASVRMAEIGPP